MTISNKIIKMLYFLIINLIFFCFFYCVTGTKITNEELNRPSYFSFQDKDSLISLIVENGFNHHELLHENEKYYIFEWYDYQNQIEKKLMYRLEIRIFNHLSEYYNEIKNTDYESYFKKICNCIIQQKGWILLKSENVRIFHYKIDNIYGISAHLNRRNFLIQVAIFSQNNEVVQKKFDLILKNIQLL
jgi:hypothetical protein